MSALLYLFNELLVFHILLLLLYERLLSNSSIKDTSDRGKRDISLPLQCMLPIEGVRRITNHEGHPPKRWPLDRELFFLETSVPGIFAAGDVRHGSIKRVASSVGEGAMAVQFIHRYLG